MTDFSLNHMPLDFCMDRGMDEFRRPHESPEERDHHSYASNFHIPVNDPFLDRMDPGSIGYGIYLQTHHREYDLSTNRYDDRLHAPWGLSDGPMELSEDYDRESFEDLNELFSFAYKDDIWFKETYIVTHNKIKKAIVDFDTDECITWNQYVSNIKEYTISKKHWASKPIDRYTVMFEDVSDGFRGISKIGLKTGFECMHIMYGKDEQFKPLASAILSALALTGFQYKDDVKLIGLLSNMCLKCHDYGCMKFVHHPDADWNKECSGDQPLTKHFREWIEQKEGIEARRLKMIYKAIMSALKEGRARGVCVTLGDAIWRQYKASLYSRFDASEIHVDAILEHLKHTAINWKTVTELSYPDANDYDNPLYTLGWALCEAKSLPNVSHEELVSLMRVMYHVCINCGGPCQHQFVKRVNGIEADHVETLEKYYDENFMKYNVTAHDGYVAWKDRFLYLLKRLTLCRDHFSLKNAAWEVKKRDDWLYPNAIKEISWFNRNQNPALSELSNMLDAILKCTAVSEDVRDEFMCMIFSYCVKCSDPDCCHL